MNTILASERFECDSSGLRLVGERWAGLPDRDPVVLLHGAGQTRHSWRDTAMRLAAHGVPTISLDLRGHGESQWQPDGDYSLDGFVADLRALVGSLDRSPVLMAASLGGLTALVAAGENPGLAKAVVLVDVCVHPDPDGAERVVNFMSAHSGGFASLEDVSDAIAGYKLSPPRREHLDGLKKNVRLAADGRWYWHWDPKFMAVDAEPRRGFDTARVENAASQLAVPAMIVRGAQSDLVSEAAVDHLLGLMPRATVCSVPGVGHMVAGDDNPVFTTDLFEFLARVQFDGHNA